MSPLPQDLSHFQEWYHQHEAEIQEDFFAFLRFKSISADPAQAPQMHACAQWVKKQLESLEMEVEMWETPYYPVVFASHSKAGKDKPTLLIYHHYDVQPADPIELWESDPFKPEVRHGKVYARGSSDNKGPCFYSITAIRAFLESSQSLNFNLKICIEGEEESGSRGLDAILEAKKEALKADYLLVIDTEMLGPNTPSVTLGARGIVMMHMECRGAATDLHSGMHGGIAFNPNRALVNALSKLWNENGKIAVPGFYDGILPIDEEDLQAIDMSFDLPEYVEHFGVTAFDGEKGLSIRESNWLRPTLEINGISGGYTGPGFKTVIPAVAVANLSCRLVPGQDPKRICQLVINFLKDVMQKGIQIEVEIDTGGEGMRLSSTSKIATLVANAFTDVFGKKCGFRLTGGSIPVTVKLARTSGAEALFMGVTLATDNFHAPDEHFRLDGLKKGFLTMIRIFQSL